jgi:predicted dehydrogenase
MKKLNVAVVGTGHLGSIHARVYSQLKNVRLVGACDCDRQRAEEIARRYDAYPFSDYRDLFGRVDAVSIAVPTCLHYKIAREFLKRGIHVLIEKPITNNIRQADHLIRLSQERKLILQVGHIERFNPAFQAVRRLIKKPAFIESHRVGPFKGRSVDISVVLDLMIHDLDIVLSIVKSRLVKLQAKGVKVISNHADIANVRLTFASGAVCNLTVSRLSESALRKIRIFQKDLYISLDFEQDEAKIFRKVKDKIQKHILQPARKEPLKAELSSFVNCILFKKRPMVAGKEARDVLKVALAIDRKIK